MTADEHRDAAIEHINALHAMVPPPPVDEWTPTPPNFSGEWISWPADASRGTVWVRDQPPGRRWLGEGSGPHMQRLSGLGTISERVPLTDTKVSKLTIANHANALDEFAANRAEFVACTFEPDHYALFASGPVTDLRFDQCVFRQKLGRESVIRVYEATRLEFDSCIIQKEPYEPYTKSPIRIHDSPSVRFKNCKIEGGSAIHVGAASEHLVNDRDLNPCGEFEMRDCTWSFHGLYPDDPGPFLRVPGCRKIKLVNVAITGRGYPMLHIHRLADGTTIDLVTQNVTFNGEMFDRSTDIKWI